MTNTPDRGAPSYLDTMAAKRSTAETDFAAREAAHFRKRQRRLQLLAQWAAPQIGGHDADWRVYQRDLIDADFTDGDRDDALIAKVRHDLENAGVTIASEDIAALLSRYAAQAEMESDPRHPLSSTPRST